MKLVHDHRRVFVLAIAVALLGGLAAWRLSATAQAHRAHGTQPTAGREQMQRPGAGRFRVQPGGPLLGRACFLIRAGSGGGHVQLVPVDSPRPVLRDCSEHPCVELIAGSCACVGEVFGGGYREALPALPERPLMTCNSRVLPPGYAVPLGR